MRHNSKNLISVVLGSFLLLLGACAESDLAAIGASGSSDENGQTTVSIDVSIENTSGGTRGDYDYTQDPTQLGTYISTGQKIDALIYAVYQMTSTATGDKQFDLLAYFKDSSKSGVSGIEGGNGQTVDNFSARETKHITLKVDPELDYRIVFWAQSSSCTAYTTTDFKEIKISYKDAENNDNDAKNNDETRDAFCGWVDLLADSTNRTAKAVLRRPFAQINVGTTGADYKNLIYDPNLLPNGITITQSKMTVTGVANRYNALTGKATISEDSKNNPIAAEFTDSWLPAWIQIQLADGGCPIPFDESYTEDNNPFVDNSQASEEFLLVDLNNDYKIADYSTKYPTIKYTEDEEGEEKKTTLYLTETFKYLSMCYVLVPSATDNEGSTVTVNYTLHQKKSDDDETPISLAEKTLNNVPVQANWRTNILHGLYKEDYDPTSIFSGVTMPVIIMNNFDYHYVNTDINKSDDESTTE